MRFPPFRPCPQHEPLRATKLSLGSAAPAVTRYAAAGLALALMSSTVLAQTLADHDHTVWTEQQGLAAEVFSITPVPNGMLRIRTTVGNQVFDGVEFHSPVRTPAGAPYVDPADLVGQLSPSGAVYYIDPNTLRLMERRQGVTAAVEDKDGIGWWTRFVFDSRGIGWYFKEGGVFRLEGHQVRALDESWGIPSGLHASYRPVIDAQDTVWFANPDRLYRLPRDARRFEPVNIAGCDRPAFAPDGALWCSSAAGLSVVTFHNGVPARRQFLSTKAFGPMLFDSRGGFWVRTPAGLAHAARWQTVLAPGGIKALLSDALTPAQGLSSLSINMIFEDAGGTVWVGTSTGLERFRPPRFLRAAFPHHPPAGNVRPDPDGGFWLAPDSGPLLHLSDDGAAPVPAIQDVATIRPAPNGRLWVATRDALWRRDAGGTFDKMSVPGLSSRGRVHQIAEDDTGAVWLQAGYQLLRWSQGQLAPFTGPSAPPSEGRYVMVHDRQGQLWFVSNEREGPYVLRHGVFRKLQSRAYADTMAQGWVAAVHGARVWVGGRTGVGAFEGDEFRPLKSRGDVLKAITGIVETHEGELWMYGLSKVFRLSAEQVKAGLRGDTIEPEVLDRRDGLRGTNDRLYAPTLTQDASGRLWVSTNEGVFWIDPRGRRTAPPPPVTMVGALRSDADVRPVDGRVQVSAASVRVQFSFAAAALSDGDDVHFRYRIPGIDTDWQEVGTRRTAEYTQLPPGRHRFEVMARHRAGIWPATPSALDFEVLPAWYQTWWWRLLVAVFAVGLLWWSHRLRVTVLNRREQTRMRAILTERERIARELHDTLLQSMQGVILDFQSVASTLPDHDATRRSIETRLDDADRLLEEARHRVRDLRGGAVNPGCLRAAFEDAAMQLADTAQVSVTDRGRPRRMRPDAQDRLYLIGREALLNAVVHGKGSPITVELDFGMHRFVLRVRDQIGRAHV